MSESEPSRVFMFDNGDPVMQAAYEEARKTFRYFWREVAWERRRIVPALDMACVKAPFYDKAQGGAPIEGKPEAEQMWLGEVDFDGQRVSGVLLNSPNWLKSIKEGDSVCIPLGEISDWMYAINGQVYGAYTVNAMRFRMGNQERIDHDDAWGMDFGDPTKIRVAEEDSISEAMVPSLIDRLQKDPSMVNSKDDKGWTLLHHQALAGSTATVQVLLEHGADRNAVTDHGMTPRQLAESLAWDKVVALLISKGASE